MSDSSTLNELLNQFEEIKTWTKEKFKLKARIVNQIKSEKCYIFTGSKNFYKLSKFGDKRKISSNELEPPHKYLMKHEKIEIICIGKEHCDYMFIAVRKLIEDSANK